MASKQNAKVHYIHSSNKATKDYEHLEIRIAQEADEYRQDKPSLDRTLVLTWQRSVNGENPLDWYGLHIQVDTNSLENASHVLGILKRVCGKTLDLGWGSTPQQVMDRLTAIGAIECARDPRLSEWVPIQDLAPADFKAWRDVTPGKNGCIVGCLARDEHDAKILILQEFARLIAKHTYSSYAADLAEWLEGGRKVRMLDGWGWGPPDYTRLQDRIDCQD